MALDKQKNTKMMGKQSIRFTHPPYIISAASIACKKEGEGPLGKYFDTVEEDHLLGKECWEEAESELQKRAAELAISKAGLKNQDIRYLLAGDLLGQLIATSFGVIELEIPMIGIYGACSTMGEAMILSSMLVDGGYAEKSLALTSSHFAGAEKQFRFPLDYGNQRPYCASWTVTGSGAVVVSDKPKATDKKNVRIIGGTIGKVVDFGLKDSMNMGAAMAPSAYNTISQNFKDNGIQPDYYDRIITGDLGYVGSDILIDMLKADGYDISNNHMDCGKEIFNQEEQDTHAGGSGCGCAAITFAGYVMKQLEDGNWKRVLFVPTGALLSQVSYNEGHSVPGIAHAVMVEAE